MDPDFTSKLVRDACGAFIWLLVAFWGMVALVVGLAMYIILWR